MHATDLIASALADEQQEPLPESPVSGVCCVTGRYTETISRKKLFGSNFRDVNRLACPDSDRVGVNVWYALMYGYYGIDEKTGQPKKRKKKLEMQACWWTDGQEFRAEIGKADIRKIVLQGVSSGNPWAGWVTTSYKKHGSFRSPVNIGQFGAWGFDDRVAHAEKREVVHDWWHRLRIVQDTGIRRKVIETADLSVSDMLKVGIDTCQTFEVWARSQYQSPLYQFLVYLLPSQQELKEGYQDAMVFS